MTLKKKLIISGCSLMILLSVINCVFFNGSKISCALNVLAMVFTIVGIVKSKDENYN